MPSFAAVGTTWGSDTPISLPEPSSHGTLVDMGGFGFTIRGIAHDFTQTDLEAFTVPTFAPDSWGIAGEVSDA